MSDTANKRATVYFEPALHQAMLLKAAYSQQSISEIVNNAVRTILLEDQQDLAAFEERIAEPEISLKTLLKELKANGKI